MMISHEVIEMPKANITIPVSLDDGNVVMVECGKFSKRCDLSKFCASRAAALTCGVSGKSGAPKQIAVFSPGWKISGTTIYNHVVAICKICAQNREQKQK